MSHNNIKTPITREFVLIVKGIAIFLMVLHHSFGFPKWYISQITYPELAQYVPAIAASTKICVAIFAFLTGWLYFSHKDKSFRYSKKKIILFLSSYWMNVLLLAIIAALFCDFRPDVKSLFFEFLPIKNHPLMIFSWYVIFYIWTMLCLPLVANILRGINKFSAIFFICLGSIFVFWLFKGSTLFAPIGIGYLYTWFPCVLAGYVFAKFQIFEKVSNFFENFSQFKLIILGGGLLCLALYAQVKLGYSRGIYNGYITAPIFILGLLFLFKKKNLLSPVLEFLGSHAMNIWFLHCIFFSRITKDIFQPIGYTFENPILVLCTILFSCSLISKILTFLQSWINRKLSVTLNL